jgi:AraC family transcriptional regulator
LPRATPNPTGKWRTGRKTAQAGACLYRAHLAENIGLQDMATVAGLGQHHFSTLFGQSMGRSPYRYVVNQRIERAKRQLRQKDAAIIDVALACGFADQSHLTKHFRKLVGMTPSAFRSD